MDIDSKIFSFNSKRKEKFQQQKYQFKKKVIKENKLPKYITQKNICKLVIIIVVIFEQY